MNGQRTSQASSPPRSVRWGWLVLCFLVITSRMTDCIGARRANLLASDGGNQPRHQPAALPRGDLDLSKLRVPPPRAHIVDSGDVLGIYVEHLLGEPPHLEAGGLPPAIGAPVRVSASGNLTLPLVPPLYVRGLTVGEVLKRVRAAYARGKVLRERIIVTLREPRYYRVVVLRQDIDSRRLPAPAPRRFSIRLPAYENDICNSLARTGGLPESSVKIRVIRASMSEDTTILPEFLLGQAALDTASITLGEGDIVIVAAAGAAEHR